MMSWTQGLIEALKETPFGFLFFSLGLVAVVACGVMAVVAVRRRRRIAAARAALAAAARTRGIKVFLAIPQ